MSSAALQWGPVAIIMIGLVLGFYFNNRSIAHLDRRIDDLRAAVDYRFDAVDHRFDDLRAAVDHRFDDMREWIRAEFKRLDDRIDNLTAKIAKMEEHAEHPVIKAG